MNHVKQLVPHHMTEVAYSICCNSNKRKWLLSVREKTWDIPMKEIPFLYHVQWTWLQHFLLFRTLSY